MKTITIHAFNKGEAGGSMNQSVRIDGVSKEQINKAKEDFFATVGKAYSRWWYEVECLDDLTPAEEAILEELELENDF